MFKPLELFIGQRYTHSRRRNRFISFISFASMLGIMLGVMVLITILSIMNGFENELRSRILGVVSHVTVSGTDGKLSHWQEAYKQLEKAPHVVGAAPYIQKQVMVANGKLLRGVLMQGIQPELQTNVSDTSFQLLAGSFGDLVPRQYSIILGAGLAEDLQVYPGDKVTVVVPQVQVTPAGVLPRVRRFTVAGVFSSGQQEFDNFSAYIHLEDAGRLFKMPEEVSGVRLKLDDLFKAQSVSQQLQHQLGNQYKVADWSVEHGVFFRAVKMEKIAMSFILFLVVAVALFNLVASLMMAVNDKSADIAILRTFGLEPKRVQRIFMIQGSIIGVIGTVVGAILGVLLASNIHTIIPAIENAFGFKVFPAEVFAISEIPSDLRWSDVALISLAALVFSVLATLYPSWRASQIQPAESLRYE
ncbi:lipoprotein-releasing ABC transporter permease subunit [Thiolinea disciformis]|uniref:lipoprotein-releasing ABC transporter permease subunit n=1 Tax=Thiolinea disciformis TaxID=125614 RepID=UPI00039DB240|nr:lipoprotein-releasing ABC transporter permease subunit [Thiolinea disciformis]